MIFFPKANTDFLPAGLLRTAQTPKAVATTKNEQYLLIVHVLIYEPAGYMTDFLNTVELERDKEGHCIRCSKVISYNTETPFCDACYQVWDQHKNPDHEEDYCHCCGNMNYTSRSQPECYSCHTRKKYAEEVIAKTG